MISLTILGLLSVVWSLVLAGLLLFRGRVPPVLGAAPLALPLIVAGLWGSGATTEAVNLMHTVEPSVWFDVLHGTLDRGVQIIRMVGWATVPGTVVICLAGGIQGAFRTPRRGGMFWAASALVFLIPLVHVAGSIWLGTIGLVSLSNAVLLLLMGVGTALAFLGAGRDTAGAEAAATAGLAFAIGVMALSLAERGQTLHDVLSSMGYNGYENRELILSAGWSLVNQTQLVAFVAIGLSVLVAGLGLGAVISSTLLRRVGSGLGFLWLFAGLWAYQEMDPVFGYYDAELQMSRRVYQPHVVPRSISTKSSQNHYTTYLAITSDNKLWVNEQAVGTAATTDAKTLATAIEAAKTQANELMIQHQAPYIQKANLDQLLDMRDARIGGVYRHRLQVLVDRNVDFSQLKPVLQAVAEPPAKPTVPAGSILVEPYPLLYTQIELVVQRESGYGVILVDLTNADWEAMGTGRGPALNVFVNDTGYVVDGETIPCEDRRCDSRETYDSKAFRHKVKSIVKARGLAPDSVVLIPADNVDYEVVIEALDALRGNPWDPDDEFVDVFRLSL